MNQRTNMVAFCTTWEINYYVLRPLVPLKFWQSKRCFCLILFSSNMLLAVTEMLQYVSFSNQAKNFFCETCIRANKCEKLHIKLPSVTET